MQVARLAAMNVPTILALLGGVSGRHRPFCQHLLQWSVIPAPARNDENYCVGANNHGSVGVFHAAQLKTSAKNGRRKSRPLLSKSIAPNLAWPTTRAQPRGARHSLRGPESDASLSHARSFRQQGGPANWSLRSGSAISARRLPNPAATA